jgi:opacity protein-like surface antigen
MMAGKLVLIAALLTATPVLAQSSRARHGEIYVYPVFTDGKSYSFEGGSTARTDTGFGLGFGYNYNFNSKFSAGIELEWSEQDYRATVQPGPANANLAGDLNGTIESSTIRFQGTWNMLERAFTPYLSGGLGWTYIDTNIPTGLAEGVCWSYPWYGTYCAAYVPTATTTEFSYNAALGLRWDIGRGLLRAQVNSQWVDFGGSYGSESVIQYRIDFGTKF